MKKKVLIFGASSFLAQNYIKFDNNNKLFCIGGGKSNSITLKQLTEKCQNLTKNYSNHFPNCHK